MEDRTAPAGQSPLALGIDTVMQSLLARDNPARPDDDTCTLTPPESRV